MTTRETGQVRLRGQRIVNRAQGGHKVSVIADMKRGRHEVLREVQIPMGRLWRRGPGINRLLPPLLRRA